MSKGSYVIREKTLGFETSIPAEEWEPMDEAEKGRFEILSAPETAGKSEWTLAKKKEESHGD